MIRTRAKRPARERALAFLLLALVVGWGLSVSAKPAEAAFPGTNGKVAFHSNRVTIFNPQGDFEVFTMNPDGTGVSQLTLNDDFDGQPAFSPDGQHITFTSDRDGDAEDFTMRANGSKQRKLTRNGTGDGRPAWSPNGKRIAFVSTRDGNAEIYVMTVYGTGKVNRSNNPASDFSPDWQPL